MAVDDAGISQPGKYGPADDGGHSAQKGADLTRRTYEVCVKKDCEEDDPQADRVDNAYFLVTLTEVGTIPYSLVQKMFSRERQESNRLEEVRQALDVVLKSAQLCAGMVAMGRSPRVFYFDQRVQGELAQNSEALRRLASNPKIMESLFVGLKQTIERCVDGGVFVLADAAVDFVDRDADRNGNPIPIIDERNNTIAGVRCDLMHPIQDTGKQEQIKERLRNLTLNIRYERPPSPEWVARQRERGKTDQEIRRKNTMVRLNARLRLDNRPEVGTSTSICWRADDPNMYQFERIKRPPRRRGGPVEGEGKNDNGEGGGGDEGGSIPEMKQEEPPPEPPEIHTVASYFLKAYNIRLRFPHLPMIYIGKKEWFPLEFVFQASNKTRGANSADHVNGVLKYHDENSGTDCLEVRAAWRLSLILTSPPVIFDCLNVKSFTHIRQELSFFCFLIALIIQNFSVYCSIFGRRAEHCPAVQTLWFPQQVRVQLLGRSQQIPSIQV